ncbi:hypothetical protein BUALT_Bualt06G0021200 [Buddleja alternifolia]|uniref:Uncharacterized protein n=1 Tax=Buddleja alternifolia TaxID=168488 RepID=A0AAV6XJY5_9LAMI|nr:hypothetical protein BUALT_Bualt06G0021200 [Buddleja alternifolia]
MVPTLSIARWVGCYYGLVWASSRLAIPMGSLSERCVSWLFACDDGIPWAWGAQVSCAKMVPTLGIVRRTGGCVSGGWRVLACWIPAWAATIYNASLFIPRLKCLFGLAGVGFLVLTTHFKGIRLDKTSQFRLVLRPSRPRRRVYFKAFTVLGLLAHGVLIDLSTWNSEWARGPQPLFAPKTSVRHFVRTTVIFVLTGSSGSAHAKPASMRNATWLILPVVICLSQRLSHACGSADVAYRTPPIPYEKSKSLGSGGSMVARLKLKRIDERAHQEWSLWLNLT